MKFLYTKKIEPYPFDDVALSWVPLSSRCWMIPYWLSESRKVKLNGLFISYIEPADNLMCNCFQTIYRQLSTGVLIYSKLDDLSEFYVIHYLLISWVPYLEFSWVPYLEFSWVPYLEFSWVPYLEEDTPTLSFL